MKYVILTLTEANRIGRTLVKGFAGGIDALACQLKDGTYIFPEDCIVKLKDIENVMVDLLKLEETAKSKAVS